MASPNERSVVLTILGVDRPGLVEMLSDIVAGHGANWEASHMAHLAGRFAGILLLSIDPSKVERLVDDLRQLQDRGLTVVVEPSGGGEPDKDHRTLTLDLVGHDRAGIIREISKALSAHEINVEELSTECISAPMSGETLFHMTAIIHSPKSLSIDEVLHDLEGIANEMMVDISLHDGAGNPDAD